MTAPHETTPFAWPVRVYYEDTDAQGVVYYANYFRFLERARTEWLRALGIDQDALLYEQRRMFVVVDVNASFQKPALFNDELVVTARLAGMTRASFDIEQFIYRDKLDGDLLVRCHIKAAFLDADSKRPLRVPASFFEGPQS